VNEACTALSVSRSKLYEELQSGRLTARKSGARTLIPVASIDAWLNDLPTLPEAAKAA
jgi:excisionase family DNA binding protein